jgi:hypothetical protein
MAITAQDVFNITMDLIDERQDDGMLSTADTVSYLVKTPGLLTLLQAELIKQGDIYSTYEISNYPVPNLLGERSNFDVRPFEGTELTYECAGSAKAYYFEVDNDAAVYVEDYNGSWNTLSTITTAPNTSGFTAYKGVVTPSSGATRSRLRFTGSYYYRNTNRALFGVAFASAGDVPVYQHWVKNTMPADFKSVNEIINEYCDGNYIQSSGYKWEGRRDLYVDYYYKGKIRIVYRPVPGTIAAITDSMQVDDVTARTIIPYGLAAHLLLTENADSAGFFQQRYDELKAIASKMPPAASEMIENMYGGFG